MSNQLVKLLKENELYQETFVNANDTNNPQSDAILQSNIAKINYENSVRILVY